MDAADRAAALTALIRRLAAAMDEERRRLEAWRLDRLAEVQADRTILSEAYAAEVRRLRAEPTAFDGLPPADRAGLRAAALALHQALEANVAALRAARARLHSVDEAIGAGLSRSLGSEASGVRPAASPSDPATAPSRGSEASGRVIRVAFGRRAGA